MTKDELRYELVKNYSNHLIENDKKNPSEIKKNLNLIGLNYKCFVDFSDFILRTNNKSILCIIHYEGSKNKENNKIRCVRNSITLWDKNNNKRIKTLYHTLLTDKFKENLKKSNIYLMIYANLKDVEFSTTGYNNHLLLVNENSYKSCIDNFFK